MLNKGSTAPDFSLPNQKNEQIRLYDLLEKGPVVLYFYPRDETRGCTAEACAFRDAYQDFQDAGAEVVGVSADSAEDHNSFAENHRLPFLLLSDPEKRALKLFKVPKSLFILPGRVTYVIGKDKKILHAFNSMFKPEQHVKEAFSTFS